MANTRNMRDHKLELFCLYVEHGKTPPPDLQKFVAEGVREFLADGKPWPLWEVKKPTRLSKWRTRKLAIQAAMLKEIGITNHRIAEILNLIDKNGKDYGKTIRDYAKDGQAVIAIGFESEFECRYAAEGLIESLTQGEHKLVSDFLARFDLDSEEPNYE